MDIQRADPEQAPRLKQVAVAAKGYWGCAAAWMRRWGSMLALAPEDIRANDVYVAAEGDEIIGFYALIRRGDVCKLDHLWAILERIGTAVGRALFAHALRRATRIEWYAGP